MSGLGPKPFIKGFYSRERVLLQQETFNMFIQQIWTFTVLSCEFAKCKEHTISFSKSEQIIS